jgi:DCN1-like protein 1/2
VSGTKTELRTAPNDEKDTVAVNGTMTYLNDLGVNLENAELLVALEIVQAPAVGEMSKQGFVDGWSAVG